MSTDPGGDAIRSLVGLLYVLALAFFLAAAGSLLAGHDTAPVVHPGDTLRVACAHRVCSMTRNMP